MSAPDRRVGETTRSDERRCRGEGGVAIVEFALVLPVVALFVLGIIDFGTLWRQNNIAEDAVLSAGRTVSSTARNRYADYEALRALSSALSGVENAEISKVVIWKANSYSDPPSSCTSINPGSSGTFGVSGLCNVYSAAQVNTIAPVGFPATSSQNPTCTAGSWDARWCPTSRVNAEGNGDWIGVWVELDYTSVTGIVPGGSFAFSAQAVYRLEPPYVGG